MSPARLNELISRLSEEGSLSIEEERELGLALQESPEARRLVVSYFRLEGALLEQARAGLLLGGAPARHAAGRRPLPRRGAGAWLSGIAAAGILLAFFLYSQRDPGEEMPLPHPRPPVLGRGGAPASSEAPSPIPAESSPGIPSSPEHLPSSPAPRSAAPVPLPATAEPGTPVTLPSPPSPESLPLPRTESEPGKPKETVLTEIQIERVEGDVVLVSAGTRVPGKTGDIVPSGQGLETGSGRSLAVLSYPDGTRIEARSDTVLRNIREKGPAGAKTGKSLYLQHGSVWAQVRPQPDERPFIVQSPRGEARVLGTVFTLRMDPDPKGLLRLDVQEGSVHFTRSSDGRAVDVGAGHSASSGQSADLVALRSQELIQSFQDGRFPAADYAGTRDTQLVEKSPQTAFGSAKTLLAEAEDAKEKRKASWPLLRWDLGSVPPGSRVHSAWVSLHVVEPSRGQTFNFFEPARSWTEAEATWKLASAGAPWRFPGSLGSAERWSAPLGTLTPLQKGEYTSMLGDAGIALVQSWINAPATNLGLQIAGSTAGAGFHFSSREAPAPESRPRLTLVYTPRK